ncbi:hypothetical protein MKW98_004251 [Papaver atlanticum]|uniref:alanine--tRNA ligase n=1 Tax=Papaver atlanticum TaxID=357466 RepID=A0AAD4T8R7_9MAGN|nr:hypothetical protein MKW98_004251 [Papaver atlanticum]
MEPWTTTTDWSANDVRETFINFFQDKDHLNWESSSHVVPVNDPTLLFVNAGTAVPNTALSKYHYTLFEMLGNWSFGDYFETDAISWVWELLTEEMGDTGPCGPCTEIHFDGIDNQDAASLVNDYDPTCIELWNLVFTQCNSEADGSLKPLPPKHVNTGMGFGRLAWILQNKNDQNDTDVFMPIFNKIMWTKLTWLIGLWLNILELFVLRLPMDGSLPDNEGREYVLRRILRQGVRYGREVLKGQELKQHKEISFGKTLLFFFLKREREGHYFKCTEKFKKWTWVCFSYGDTYVFHLDLIQLMAEERGLQVDVKGFKNAVEELVLLWKQVSMLNKVVRYLALGPLAAPLGHFKFVMFKLFDGFVIHIGSYDGETGEISVVEGDVCDCSPNWKVSVDCSLPTATHTDQHLQLFRGCQGKRIVIVRRSCCRSCSVSEENLR